MPLYEYQCQGCKNQFSALKKIAEKDTPSPCPECQSSETDRLISGFATSGGGGGARSAPPPRPGGFSWGGGCWRVGLPLNFKKNPV